MTNTSGCCYIWVQIWPWNSTVHNRPWTSIQDLLHPKLWQTPVAAVRIESQFDHEIVQCKPALNIYTGFTPSQLTTNTSGCCYIWVPIWPWNSTVHNRPWTYIQDLFHPNSRQTPVAAVTFESQFGHEIIQCTTDLELLYRICSIPTYDKHQWLLLHLSPNLAMK